MAEMTEIASLRVRKGTVASLRMMAHKRSLELGKDVTWSSMIREVLEQELANSDIHNTKNLNKEVKHAD